MTKIIAVAAAVLLGIVTFANAVEKGWRIKDVARSAGVKLREPARTRQMARGRTKALSAARAARTRVDLS